MSELIAVWFSHGAPSAAALYLTVQKYGRDRVRAVNNPIAEEDEDNHRFGRQVAEWCGVEIEEFGAPKWPAASAVDVWAKRRAMAFPNGAPCTRHLKVEARQAWEALHKPAWHVLGFTMEEKRRHDRFVQSERENVLPLLIDAGMRSTTSRVTMASRSPTLLAASISSSRMSISNSSSSSVQISMASRLSAPRSLTSISASLICSGSWPVIWRRMSSVRSRMLMPARPSA